MQFEAEVALLAPLGEGAGVIYVVDGAVPYGPEYEAEMEILRWSGRPSLAVINPIGQLPQLLQMYDSAIKAGVAYTKSTRPPREWKMGDGDDGEWGSDDED